MRCKLSTGKAEKLPAQYYYHGPQFRYERPQLGRLRQFHQFGVECLGRADALSDAEVVDMACQVLDQAVDLKVGQHVQLRINSLGTKQCMDMYELALMDFFQDKPLSALSQQRLLDKKPLRILDSKEDTFENVPLIHDFLSPAAQARFSLVKHYLDILDIPYSEDPQLVRGLDYYSHTCFEFVGLNNKAVLAGGRYDGLATALGSKTPIPAVGWAAGIERLCLENRKRDDDALKGISSLVVPKLSGDEEEDALVMDYYVRTLQTLRKQDPSHMYQTHIPKNPRTNMKKLLKQADGCTFLVTVGVKEMHTHTVSRREMATKLEDTLKVVN